MWTIAADGGESIVEGYGYSTDILSAYTNGEQRVQRRDVPLQTLEFGIVALEAREGQLATSTIFGSQNKVIAMPLWQYGSRLVGDVAIGATLLPITDAVLIPYRVGGYAVVWRDAFTWELFTVTATSGAGVATSDTSIALWKSGTAMVFPARRAMLPDRVSLKRDSTTILKGRVRFTMEQDLP